MAEIISADSRNKKSNRRQHKSTRVDLTPMVDLGFLLITFFVFTSTMSKPVVMKLYTPDTSVPPNNPVCASCVLTVLLDTNHTMLFYEGSPLAGTMLRSTAFSRDGIRNVLLQKKRSVQKLRGSASEMVLIVKPLQQSTLQDFVNIMDEVAINDIHQYYVDEPDAADKNLMINNGYH